MTPVGDLGLVLTDGRLARRIPLADLAQVLGLDLAAVRGACRGLLHSSAGVDIAEGRRERGTIGGEGTFIHSIIQKRERKFETFMKEEKEGGLGEEGEGNPAQGALAEEVARALDAWESLAFLKRLVARLPPDQVREALARTLSVPPERIRKSRGAYFTVVLRALTKAPRPPRSDPPSS